MESVLLVGNYRPSVTVVRALGRAGMRVIVGLADGEDSFAERSRHCAETWAHPPVKAPGKFLDALSAFLAARPDVTLLMPVQQAAVALVARNLDRLPAGVTPVLANPPAIEACLDKARMFGLAEATGVPVQPFAITTALDELAPTAARIGWPVIVRPAGRGSERLPGAKKAITAANAAALARETQGWPEHGQDLLVQTFAPGPRHNVYFAARQGRILDRVEVLILRTDLPDDTGIAVEGVSLAPNPELDDYSARLVGALDYTGVGCLQFLREPDGRFHFIEINPRLGANYVIADRCGLDLALIACRLAAGAEIAPRPAGSAYPVGVRYAWTLGDLRAIRRARARGEITGRLALRRAAQAVAAGLRADVHLTWSAADPMPALRQYAGSIPFGIGRRLFPG